MGEDKFMTIVVLALEQDGIFTYSGAHEDIIVWRSSTGTIEEIETNGMWIGLEPDISHFLKTDTLLLNPGDCMVLYTDGVTEARDENNDLFSNEKLGSLAIPVVAPNRIVLTCCNSMQYCFGINI